ncbi:hypothetical protein ACFLYK_01650 [Candidatus Cloacimonadota bacterium]
MNLYKLVFIILITMIVLTACTQKKNSVGFIPGMEPKIMELDFSYFGNFLSYEDSIGNYYNNSKLVIGNYFSSNFQNKAYTLLRTVTLPDTIISLEGPVIIQLEKGDSYNFADISVETIKLGKLQNTWKENEATWYNATDTLTWSGGSGFSESDYELMEFSSVEVDGDSIFLEIPGDMLIDWVENDSTNFGITIFTDQDDAFLEMLSAESESVFLDFNYTTADIDSVVNFNAKFTSDTFIYETDEEYQRFNNELKISNIQPIKMYLDFNISDSVFINYEGSGIENSDDYRRMTINKAELILSTSDVSNFPLDGSIALVPYLVLADSLDLDDTSVPLLQSEDYESFYDGTATDSLDAQDLVINMKYIVQYITAGERENHGIMIESIYENRDFLNAVFADLCYENVDRRPRLRIIYTPPYLDE